MNAERCTGVVGGIGDVVEVGAAVPERDLNARGVRGGELRCANRPQHVDRRADIGFTQSERFVEFVDGEARHVSIECACHLDQAVAVGVGLDHRHDARRRHERSECLDVADDRAEIDPQLGDHRVRSNREAVSASGIPKNKMKPTMSRSNV